ncbi:MAG: glycerol-3-phosphate acyltransferase [Desulfobacterales bacterium]|nr:glycerol-3-phosphate acyltransferase [Desulfobacterales bacterium]
MLKSIKSKFTRFRAKTKEWTDTILQGTHNHYSCYLPENIGTAASFTSKLFYSGITIGEDQMAELHDIPKDAIIVYAGQHKSYFEYLFYHTRYRENGLPLPEIGFGYESFILQPVSRIFRMIYAYLDHICQHMSVPDPYKSEYIREELVTGRAAFLSLVEKKGFYRRFVKAYTDPVQYLIEMQRTVDRPIYIIPHLMFFSISPRRAIPTMTDVLFGSEEKPGKIRRLVTLFNNPGKVFVEISEPVNLRHFMETPEVRDADSEIQALVLRRRLLIQMNRHRQSITGPVLKSTEELKESILTNDRLRNFMEKYSQRENAPHLYKIHKEADEYIDEIAAKYSPATIRLFSIGVTWITRLMFEGITVNEDDLNKVKNMARKGPLILVPCHKSHIDYLVLSYILYHNNMPCPLIAAGKNLSFWPMGPLFRRAGAYFIRRTFKGAILYSKVFSEYLYKILEEGFNLEFFIEGGRSRTGKLIQPKFGLLSMLLNAFKDGACNDLIFTPVYIGYDRIPEESSYVRELEGGQKKQESLLQVIKARKFLKRRYGKIYIRFHEPFSLNEFLSQNGSNIEDMSSKEMNTLCRSLGYKFINAIDSITVVTPHAIVASAILNCQRQRFTYEHIISDVETYMNYLFVQEAKLADTLLIDYIHAVEYVFEIYINRKFIERVSAGKDEQPSEVLYMINTNKRPSLEYYKNNGITYFIPAAFTALAILERDAFQFSTSDLHTSYNFLQEFFNNEFAYDIDKTPEHLVRRNIKAFIDDAIIIPHPTLPDTYNLTSAGFRKLKLFSGFLKSYFESYRIVLNVFVRYPKDFISNSKNIMKKSQSIGYRMYKRKEIEGPEALSKSNYKNAVDFFTSHQVKGSEDSDKIEFYTEKIQKYLDRLSS